MKNTYRYIYDSETVEALSFTGTAWFVMDRNEEEQTERAARRARNSDWSLTLSTDGDDLRNITVHGIDRRIAWGAPLLVPWFCASPGQARWVRAWTWTNIFHVSAQSVRQTVKSRCGISKRQTIFVLFLRFRLTPEDCLNVTSLQLAHISVSPVNLCYPFCLEQY